jgi:hypothetical protein
MRWEVEMVYSLMLTTMRCLPLMIELLPFVQPLLGDVFLFARQQV